MCSLNQFTFLVLQWLYVSRVCIRWIIFSKIRCFQLRCSCNWGHQWEKEHRVFSAGKIFESSRLCECLKHFIHQILYYHPQNITPYILLIDTPGMALVERREGIGFTRADTASKLQPGRVLKMCQRRALMRTRRPRWSPNHVTSSFHARQWNCNDSNP